MMISYINNEIKNNSVLFLLNSNIYFENIILENIINVIKINKYEIEKDNMLLEKVFNTYTFNNKKKVILITDTNLLGINMIKRIIKLKNDNTKIIFCINGILDKIIKKINKKNTKIKNLITFENEYDKKIKYKKYKINDYNFNSQSIDLYDSCNKILLKNDLSDLNELYNIFLSEKVYIPLTIHNNYYKYTKNEEIINHYLDLYSYSDLIQDTIFKDGSKELLYLYFIITCIIPSKLLKQTTKKEKKTDIKLKFSNVISYISLLIINKNKYYNKLKETKLISFDKNYVKEKIIEINNDNSLLKQYNLTTKQLKYFLKYFNLE